MILSIIIPIYNVEHYLEKNLKQIFKQIDKIDEVILINDGSSDKSLEICRKYEEMYPFNIKLINKKNEGVAISRNLGLNIATGDYIIWIDGDDWIDDNYITCIKNTIMNTKADIILFDYYKVLEGKFFIVEYDKKSGYINKNKLMKEIAQDAFFSFLWRTVAKREIYINIKFPEKVQMMEDFSIYHILFNNAEKFFYIHKPLYYYKINNTSLSHTKEQDIFSRYECSLKRERFFRKYYVDINEKYRIVPVLINACAVSEFRDMSNEEIGNIYILIKKYIIFLLTRKYINNKKKFQLVMCLISPKLLSKIRKIYKLFK